MPKLTRKRKAVISTAVMCLIIMAISITFTSAGISSSLDIRSLCYGALMATYSSSLFGALDEDAK